MEMKVGSHMEETITGEKWPKFLQEPKHRDLSSLNPFRASTRQAKLFVGLMSSWRHAAVEDWGRYVHSLGRRFSIGISLQASGCSHKNAQIWEPIPC